MRPGLEKDGYTLIDTYLPQFSPRSACQKKINYPWQLPARLAQVAWDTFDYSTNIGQEATSGQRVKDIVALLGVNATSAEEGSTFFLQHSDNIGTVLRQARRLILVVGLEKIVKNSSDALFQTKCAGAFGMESVLLDLKIGDTDQEAVDHLAEIPVSEDLTRELHIILLDNGRTKIAEGYYKELLSCIGCRACAKQCSAYRYLEGFHYYPKEYLWSFLIGYNPSIELCVTSATCKLDCPVDIDIPKLMVQAKAEYSPEIAHSRTNQLLMNMLRLASAGRLGALLVNRFSDVKLLRIIVEKITGIDRRRKSPTFRYATFERWFRSHHEQT
ncbi:4Fe-4S dicluster domain-containing protein [Chloroflexota bacterium]